MASTIDWASRAAEHIIDELCDTLSIERTMTFAVFEGKQERIAAIILAYADPLITLLQKARRKHHNTLTDYGGWACGVFIENADGSTEACTCGADAWNEKIDNALKQEVR